MKRPDVLATVKLAQGRTVSIPLLNGKIVNVVTPYSPKPVEGAQLIPLLDSSGKQVGTGRITLTPNAHLAICRDCVKDLEDAGFEVKIIDELTPAWSARTGCQCCDDEGVVDTFDGGLTVAAS